MTPLATTRNPQSEARRQHVHGKLIPMDRPLKDEGRGYEQLDIWDEQPRLWVGLVVFGSGLGTIVAAVMLLRAVMS